MPVVNWTLIATTGGGALTTLLGVVAGGLVGRRGQDRQWLRPPLIIGDPSGHSPEPATSTPCDRVVGHPRDPGRGIAHRTGHRVTADEDDPGPLARRRVAQDGEQRRASAASWALCHGVMICMGACRQRACASSGASPAAVPMSDQDAPSSRARPTAASA